MNIATQNVHKVTWFFKGRTFGWTESLWFLSQSGNLVDTFAAAQIVAAVRADLLGIEASIFAIRCSQQNAGPDAILRYVNFTPTFKGATNGVPAQPVESCAMEDTALLVRCENGQDTKWKQIFMRGIWDNVETTLGVYQPLYGDWQRRITAYFNKVQNRNWGWVGVSAKTAKIDLAGYVINSDNTVTFTVKAPIIPNTIPNGSHVIVRLAGINGKSTLNGQQVVVVNSATTFTLVRPIAAVPYRTGGTATLNTYDFIGIATMIDQKIVERKVGAPLLQSRGRQRAKPRV